MIVGARLLSVFHSAYIYLYSKEKRKSKLPCLITEFLSDHFIRLLEWRPDMWEDSIVEHHYFQQETEVLRMEQVPLTIWAITILKGYEGQS